MIGQKVPSLIKLTIAQDRTNERTASPIPLKKPLDKDDLIFYDISTDNSVWSRFQILTLE